MPKPSKSSLRALSLLFSLILCVSGTSFIRAEGGDNDNGHKGSSGQGDSREGGGRSGGGQHGGENEDGGHGGSGQQGGNSQGNDHSWWNQQNSGNDGSSQWMQIIKNIFGSDDDGGSNHGGGVNGTQANGNGSGGSVNGTQANGNASGGSVNGTQANGNASGGGVNGTQANPDASGGGVNGTQANPDASGGSSGPLAATNTNGPGGGSSGGGATPAGPSGSGNQNAYGLPVVSNPDGSVNRAATANLWQGMLQRQPNATPPSASAEYDQYGLRIPAVPAQKDLGSNPIGHGPRPDTTNPDPTLQGVPGAGMVSPPGQPLPPLPAGKNFQETYSGPVQDLRGVNSDMVGSAGASGQKTLDPATADKVSGLMESAKLKMAQGEFTRALMDLDQAVDLWRDNPQAYNLKSTASSRIGHFSEAMDAAFKSIGLQSKRNPAAYEAAAWALLNLGRYEDAVRYASSAIEQNPQSALAYAIRAFAYEQLGQRDNMLNDLRMAASLDPQRFGQHLRLAKGGRRLFDPGAGDSARLLDSLDVGPMKKPIVWLALLVFGAATSLSAVGWKKIFGSSNSDSRLKEQMTSAFKDDVGDSGLLAGKYQMTRIIGKGGMGQVWEAVDHSLERLVAIKKMSLEGDTQEVKENCLKEARTLASVHHPGIVDIYEILDIPSGMYLVLELVKGKTLEQILIESKRLSLAQAKEILKPACAALDFAHARGIVHRDLKPSNFMVTEDARVKVMDFGIARRTQERLAPAAAAAGSESARFATARTRTIAGTPTYMAPEALEGLVTASSDVYALGACLYEMLTGQLPFKPADYGKIQRSYIRAALRVPGLPPEVDQLIASALHPDCAQRIKSVQEFWTALQAVPEFERVG